MERTPTQLLCACGVEWRRGDKGEALRCSLVSSMLYSPKVPSSQGKALHSKLRTADLDRGRSEGGLTGVLSCSSSWNGSLAIIHPSILCRPNLAYALFSDWPSILTGMENIRRDEQLALVQHVVLDVQAWRCVEDGSGLG